MACPRPCAGANDHLVLREVADDLVDYGEHRSAATIDETLPADFDHVGVGQDGEDRLRLRLGKQCVVRQGPMHECGAKLGQDLVLHALSVPMTTDCSLRHTWVSEMRHSVCQA